MLESEARAIAPLAELRAFSLQIPAFSLRTLGERLKIWEPAAGQPPPVIPPPTSLGESWNTAAQLRQLIAMSIGTIQRVSILWVVRRSSDAVDRAQDRFFGANTAYPYYTSPDSVSQVAATVLGGLTMACLQQEIVALEGNYTAEIVNTSAFLNPIAIAPLLDHDIGEAIDLLIDDISDLSVSIADMGLFVVIAVIVVVVVIGIILVPVASRAIRREKQRTYSCLASLPKSTVSELVEKLRGVSQDVATGGDDSDPSKEISKREENVMKVLNAGGSSSNVFSDLTIFICGTICLLGCFGANAGLIYSLLMKEVNIFRARIPHFSSVLTSYSHDLGALYALHRIGLNRSIRFFLGSLPAATAELYSYLESGRRAYYLASYGGEQMWEHPFPGWHAAIANAREAMACDSEYSNERRFSEVYNCFPPDLAYVSIEPYIVSQIEDTLPEALTGIWRLMISPLYDLFVVPLSQSILPTLIDELWSEQAKTCEILIVLIAMEAVLTVVVCLELGRISGHIRSVLRLLLHCPSVIVVQNPAIVSILSGDFSGRGRGTDRDARRDADFFESVFLRLPDAILYADSRMIVKQGNFSSGRLFEHDLTGKDLRQFFHSEKFSGNADALFDFSDGSPTETLVFHRNDGQETQIAVTIAETGTEFVASCRDVTQSLRCNGLIAEERKRSDDLLKTILPESLVPRVQAGETNICFSVDIASILFLDIVSFTPWCAKLAKSPEVVMAMLNDMFKRLDERLARKPTMTKIKCIGDCYMAAGGIFSAKDRPREHATEAVTFGLEAIEAMLELNADRDQHLEIRVGVNTGGPIVAGVLGIGKPTFEILGPAINMAQQMEHTGCRMLVHITEETYVLVASGPFKIIEHGASVKGRDIMTYIVSEKRRSDA
jgi:class 3 adenylate cyclase